jgi:hydrogenase nickel incorporation protein HypA/HybF
MHELAVTESILNIAVEHACKAGASRVTDIYLVIGRLSSIVDDSIQFYWDILSAEPNNEALAGQADGNGLLCKGAKLHFQRMPARLACLECGNEYTLDGDLTPCPKCSSARVKVIGGDEFWVESIAIETR